MKGIFSIPLTKLIFLQSSSICKSILANVRKTSYFCRPNKSPTPNSPYFGAEEIIFSKERCIVKRKSVSLPRPTGEMVGR